MSKLLSEHTSDSVQSACHAALRGGSRSFFLASLLLPRRIAHRARALYAFCRLADDLIDDGPGDEAALDTLQRRLDRIYAGTPDAHAADIAFAAVLRDIDLPRGVPNALIEGFAWDVAGRRYETIDDLHAYAARVAGSVGVMMALVMERRDPKVLARAADLGIAMQLTNIARDVGTDARRGRLYLPLAWLREEGIDPDVLLASPTFTPALGRVVARILVEAARLYARADAGIAMLPASCRPGIASARCLYAAIGDAVARNGFDSVAQRAVVGPARKLVTLRVGRRASAATLALPILPAAEVLVDGVSSPRGDTPAWWDVRSRVLAVIDLFETLERRERGAHRPA